MNFNNIKQIIMPEGKVRKIESNNTILWESTIAYEASNLVFNGTSDCINTGIYLFTSENINKDFELTVNYLSDGQMGTQGTIVCSKAEQTNYPGFVLRQQNNSTNFEISGSKTVQRPYIDCINKDIIVRRVSNVYTIQFTENDIETIPVRDIVHSVPVALGVVIKPDGTKMRYGKMTINHIKLEWK